jgi:hypothetical protein
MNRRSFLASLAGAAAAAKAIALPKPKAERLWIELPTMRQRQVLTLTYPGPSKPTFGYGEKVTFSGCFPIAGDWLVTSMRQNSAGDWHVTTERWTSP